MCVAAGVGKEQECIYTYKTKLFAVHFTQTQHCKLTIVQLKKKKKENKPSNP